MGGDCSYFIGMNVFGSFSLCELTCMHGVYLALQTHKVLCGSSYAPHINFHSFSPSAFVVFNYRPGSVLFIDLVFVTIGY